MRKKLLFVAILFATVTLSAQAPSPYPYFSFGKHDGVTPAYSVPDAAITNASALNAVGTGLSTQGLGLQAVNFDQKSQFEASTYAEDYLKTCGPTPSAFAETAATVTTIRSWVTDDANFAAGTIYSSVKEPWLGLNANPQTFRYSGGWYYYTVNFTEAGEYEFFLRLRSGNMRVVGKLVGGVAQDVNKIVTVQVFNKADMVTPIKTWTLNYGGITPNANPPATTVSSDESVSFYSWAKLDAALSPIVGQPASFWSKAKDSYTIPATGEYVIKISDPSLKIEGQDATPGAGDSNNALGSFTFIKKTTTRLNNSTQINAYANVIGRDVKVSTNVNSVEVFNLTGSKVLAQTVVNNQFSINNAGVYIIKMITAEGNKIQKVVIR